MTKKEVIEKLEGLGATFNKRSSAQELKDLLATLDNKEESNVESTENKEDNKEVIEEGPKGRFYSYIAKKGSKWILEDGQEFDNVHTAAEANFKLHKK